MSRVCWGVDGGTAMVVGTDDFVPYVVGAAICNKWWFWEDFGSLSVSGEHALVSTTEYFGDACKFVVVRND